MTKPHLLRSKHIRPGSLWGQCGSEDLGKVFYEWRHLCAVQQARHSFIHAIVVDEVFGKGNEDLPSNQLVAVHVAHILHHGSKQWPCGSPCRQTKANNWTTLTEELENLSII